MTKGGWSLADAMQHISLASEGILLPLITKHGLPKFYLETQDPPKGDAPRTYIALCRAIVGQQLAGSAVRKIWARLEGEFVEGLTPSSFLHQAAFNGSAGLEQLRSAVGLSNAKARALVSLSEFYNDGRLSDAMLYDPLLSSEEITTRLTAVKGIGPWSAQMFLMFHLHKADLLPMGDLGIRNGIAKHFGVSGSDKKGKLHEKKDSAKIEELLRPFEPYRSVACWYMWRALENKPYDEAML